MNSKLQYATYETPTVSAAWAGYSDAERIAHIKSAIENAGPRFSEAVEVVGAKKDGQVVLHMLRTLGASERGTLLLDLEDCLKKTIDQGLTVWGEALGDKNSLRNLRGIEVKTI